MKAKYRKKQKGFKRSNIFSSLVLKTKTPGIRPNSRLSYEQIRYKGESYCSSQWAIIRFCYINYSITSLFCNCLRTLQKMLLELLLNKEMKLFFCQFIIEKRLSERHFEFFQKSIYFRFQFHFYKRLGQSMRKHLVICE